MARAVDGGMITTPVVTQPGIRKPHAGTDQPGAAIQATPDASLFAMLLGVAGPPAQAVADDGRLLAPPGSTQAVASARGITGAPAPVAAAGGVAVRPIPTDFAPGTAGGDASAPQAIAPAAAAPPASPGATPTAPSTSVPTPAAAPAAQAALAGWRGASAAEAKVTSLPLPPAVAPTPKPPQAPPPGKPAEAAGPTGTAPGDAPTAAAGRPDPAAARATGGPVEREAGPAEDVAAESATDAGADLNDRSVDAVASREGAVEAPRAKAAAPPVPPIMPAEPGLKIARVVHHENGRLTLVLDPVELGPVEVSFHARAGQEVRAVILVDRADTLELLQRDLPTLERALAAAGGNGSGGLQLQLRQDQQMPGQRQDGADTGGAELAAEPGEMSPSARGPASDRLVDLVA